MTISVRLVVSTTAAAALSMLVMLTFSPQLITRDNKLSQVQLIWSPVSSWLRPPYLYLVMNCIIITIFASSKLDQHHHHSKPIKIFPTDNYYDGEHQSKLVDVMHTQSSTEIECVEVSHELYGNEDYSVPTTKPTVLVNNVQLDVSNNANVSYSDIDGNTQSANFKIRKLPGSASFVHPKLVQPNTEGRKKLGIQKPKRELETLESTWKAITDGRPMPIAHQHTSCGSSQESPNMIKSETFNQQLMSSNPDTISRTLAGSSGSGKLKRDPSPGQDELNKQVEAFISRFKEDMKLQRKESLKRHVEMINSGAY